MGETVNTSIIAELVSQKLFSHFGWDRVGSKNTNWKCVDKAHEKETHPADAVYQYDEPYENITTYALCDFKSYAKSSIKKASIKDAILNLNMSLACARKSIDWSNKFVATDKNYKIKGILLIWNHDGEFDLDFNKMFSEATKNIKIDRENIIHVLGPNKLKYLCNITNNITQLRGESPMPKLPRHHQCGFFYPELTRRRILNATSRLPMTLEYMSASYQIMRYDDERGNIKGFDIYSSDTGESKEYFIHLFDYMRHNNLLQDNRPIRIFMPFASENAHANMHNARVLYSSDIASTEKEKLRHNISFEHIPNIMTSFYPMEIGARDSYE